MKIDGKRIALELIEQLKQRVDVLKEKGKTPHLYIITFGKNDQTESYLKQKLLRADQIGAKITIKRLSRNVNTESVYKLIEKLNLDKSVNGIIVQRPLIKDLDEERISKAIDFGKDVDGFAPHSPFATPVALAVLKLIESTLQDEDIYEFLKSRKIAVIGKGVTAGQPTINLFRKLGFNVKVVDSKTLDPKKILKAADIIISAVGKKIIVPQNLKRGVILIGIGMHMENGKLKGDYDDFGVIEKAAYYSPTPGGVGPVNVTMLMKNLVEATETQFDNN